MMHLVVSLSDPANGSSQQREIAGSVVDGINEAVGARRLRRGQEVVERLLAPAAAGLAQELGTWLREEAAVRDISISGHLAGGKAKVQFILYHCVQTGTEAVWEEEDKWKATVKDDRDEAIVTLAALDPEVPDQDTSIRPKLSQSLVQFVEEV